MISFSDLVVDINAQIEVGYYCCVLVGGHLLINLFWMVRENIWQLRMRFVRCKNWRVVRKRRVKPKTKQRQNLTKIEVKKQIVETTKVDKTADNTHLQEESKSNELY
jgi:hypothetical protein